MTNEIVDFDATRRAIETAKSVDEVLTIRDKMVALIAFYKAGKDPVAARKAAGMRLLSEARIGEMSMTLKKEGGPGRGKEKTPHRADSFTGKVDALKSAGISTQEASVFERLAQLPKEELSEAAKTGKSARSILNARLMTPDELEAAGRSRGTERYHTAGGGSATRIKLTRDALVAATARIVELEAENTRLKSDLKALQTGNLMEMSRASMMQRRELIEKMKVKKEQRKAVETVPDEKTAEAYERQIKNLKGQLKSARGTVTAFMQNGKTVLDRDARKSILVCLHPDGVVDPSEKAKREKAFKLFSAAVPEPEF